MSSSEDQPGDEHPTDEELKQKVQDEKASNQQSRLRAIQRAWDEAISRRTASEDSVLVGGASSEDRLRYYRIGIEQFLMQLVSLAERTDSDEYWHEEVLGTVVIPIPERIRKAMADPQTRIPWGADRPEPVEITVVGLFGFLKQQWPARREFVLPVGRSDDIRAIGAREPTMDVLDNTLYTALRFLGQTGLDIEVEETEHRAIVDEEILKEIEKWRKQNIE